MTISNEIIGLIPAAGRAERISPLPGSKELFPIGFREIEVDGTIQIRPKVVSQYLIDNMFNAGVSKIWLVLGRGKWDIMHYYGDGSEFGGCVAYLLMEKLWGMPYTLDQAYPWLNRDTVLFGMPDTIFTPQDAFAQMLARHQDVRADVTLGIFPTDYPEKLCPVRLDGDGRVLDMTDKPPHPDIKNTWGCACWSPRFTEFMHNFLTSIAPPSNEVVLADVFKAAIREDLVVQGVFFENEEYIDVGTPDDLAVAVRHFSRS